MTDDPGAAADTHRAVGRRRIAAGEARTAVIRRRYDAPIEDVWDACTDPGRLRRWLAPVSGDLRVGGAFSLEGNAHGRVLRCEPPRLLTLSWSYWDRPADEVELRLSPGEDGDTVLEIEHASIFDVILNDPAAGLWGVGVGWELPLTYGLTAYLRGERPDDADADGLTFKPEQAEIGNRIGQAWATIVTAADESAGG